MIKIRIYYVIFTHAYFYIFINQVNINYIISYFITNFLQFERYQIQKIIINCDISDIIYRIYTNINIQFNFI